MFLDTGAFAEGLLFLRVGLPVHLLLMPSKIFFKFILYYFLIVFRVSPNPNISLQMVLPHSVLNIVS